VQGVCIHAAGFERQRGDQSLECEPSLTRPRVARAGAADAVFVPALGDEFARRPVHHNLGRPDAFVAFVRALPGRVDAQLVSERDEKRTAVIEIVDGPGHDDEIPRRIDVVEREPGNGARVVHVDVGVDDDEAARQHHHVSEPPERVHDFLRLSRIRLF
jgi:hypothetical protein